MARYNTRKKTLQITKIEMSESSSSSEEDKDSSDDFVVSNDEINRSNFFKKTSKLSTSKVVKKKESSSETDDDEDYDDEEEDDFEDVNNSESLNMFSEVLKNLEQYKDCTNIFAKTLHSPSSKTNNELKKPLIKTEDGHKVSTNEINELLLQGESNVSKLPVEDDNDGNGSFEEKKPDIDYTIPQEGVNIVLPGTSLMFNHKNKKKQQDLALVLRNKINSRLRANQVLMHKAGLLCWLHYGFLLNRQINEPSIMSKVLTMISSNNYPDGRPDLKYLEQFTRWFKRYFQFECSDQEVNITKEVLLSRLEDKKVHNYKEFVALYVALLRAMGMKCRLVISLYPPRLKLRKNQLFATKTEQEQKNKNSGKAKSASQKKKSQTTKDNSHKSSNESSQQSTTDKEAIPANSPEAIKNANVENRKKAAEILREKFSRVSANKIRTTVSVQDQSDSEQNDSNLSIKTRQSSRIGQMKAEKSVTKNKRQTTKRNHSEQSSDDDDKSKKPSSKKPKLGNVSEDDEDSDAAFEVKPPPKKRKSNNIKSNTSINQKQIRNKKLVSTDEESINEDNAEKIKNAKNMWAEVYLESEEQWICVNIMDEKIHCVIEIYKKALRPVGYIIAWNSEGSLKDVTRRYCPHWLTKTRKTRVDEKWWIESLAPWKEKDTSMSKAEDEMLLQKELEQPLPKTVGECKGHPLYALARHLLKFEALYPPNAVPLGHLSTGEAIYSRHCVHTLRSRETWVRQARVVKPYEKAYKIVKSLPKWDKLSGMKIKDQPLELFGHWQTDPYVPPEAKNGVIPRNEFGNVDLFKEEMLPKGTVHINLPALNRIAKKLNIDCAPACVGFNFGRMGALPAFEGYVVCEEYEDTLRAAWEEEQINAAKRLREKREKRIYDNWKKLIKGLFIRKRLAAQYNWKDNDEDNTNLSQKMAKLNEKLEPPKVEAKPMRKKKEETTKAITQNEKSQKTEQIKEKKQNEKTGKVEKTQNIKENKPIRSSKRNEKKETIEKIEKPAPVRQTRSTRASKT